jgi:tetratricopeptide (TPR) repeat protein
MQIGLMLNTGRVNEVEKVLDDLEEILKDGHLRYRALLAGALGDYKAFDQAVSALESALENQTKMEEGLKSVRDQLLRTSLMSGLVMQPTLTRFGQMHVQIDPLARTAYAYEKVLSDWCGLRATRGFMALEQGDTAKAARLLQDALDRNINFPERVIAVRYSALLHEQGQGK